MSIIEINAETGLVIYRDMTESEIEQKEKDNQDAIKRENEMLSEKNLEIATITAARDHAASLGFTDAMLAVMYPNLAP